MKKKDFVSLVLGVIGVLLFGIGMCMCLIPEWEAFRSGVVLGVVGALVLLIMVLVRRKMDGKPAIRLDGKIIARTLFGIFGALVLGIGMCMVMVFDMMLPGIAVGVVGIVLLITLIPLCRGFIAEDSTHGQQ